METRPEVLDPAARAAAERDDSGDEQDAGATAVTLNESSCTISVVPTFAPSRIARPETRPTTPCAVNEAVMSAVAVLLCSSVVSPRPAANAAKRLPSAFDSKLAQVGAEGAQDAGLHHVQAPQQQRHATHQVEKDDGTHCIRLAKSPQRSPTPLSAGGLS